MPKGAVIYVRVSTAEQASSNQSLPVQESKARALCQQRGLSVLKLFADKGESARTDDRPEFKKLMTYCRLHRREISHVVIADLSRLARNVLDQGQTIVELTEMGIELVSVDEPNLDDSAAGRLLKNVLGSMNQFFSDSLSEKTKDRMTAGVKQGRWLWVAPLGYRNETKTKTVVIDSERAPLIRKAFELVDEKDFGHAFKIVRSLGLTTRSGRPIPKQSLSFLLRNEFYAGQIVSKTLRIKGNHEPLISEELFQRVRASFMTGYHIRQSTRTSHSGER
jgi:site-specific DNA recombinase